MVPRIRLEAVTRVEFVRYRCRLGGPTLNRLIAAASIGCTPDQVAVAAWQDDTRYTGSDLADLLATVRRHSLQPDAAEKLDNLEIEAVAADHAIRISITATAVSVTVAAADRDWARGRAYDLDGLLRPAGARDRPVRWGGLRYGGLTALVGALSAGVATEAGLLQGRLGAGVVVSTIAVAAYVLGRGRRDRARTVIRVAGELRERRWWSAMPANEKIAWATVAISVGMILVELFGVIANSRGR